MINWNCNFFMILVIVFWYYSKNYTISYELFANMPEIFWTIHNGWSYFDLKKNPFYLQKKNNVFILCVFLLLCAFSHDISAFFLCVIYTSLISINYITNLLCKNKHTCLWFILSNMTTTTYIKDIFLTFVFVWM